MKKLKIIIKQIIGFISLSCLLFGCAYQFQSKNNPWKEMGIEKVYVRHFVNNSLVAGADSVFTSALIKEFSKGGRIKVVSDFREADAYVEGVVNTVSSSINSFTQVSQIAPDDPDAQTDYFKSTVIATEYAAFADITVTLVNRRTKETLWTQGFSQRKLYPGNNRFGELGDTSMLINRSQEEMAVADIARNLSNDVYDTMLEGF